MLAIEVEGIEKTYPKGVKALDGLSFSAEEGEVFGLAPPERRTRNFQTAPKARLPGLHEPGERQVGPTGISV